MKKILSLGLITGILAAGCGEKGNNQEKKTVLNIGVSSRYKQLDPMVSNDIPSLLITKQIFQPFFKLENGKIASDIIENYSISDNILTLEPKKNLKFSDGEEVALEDFKSSLERAINSPGCSFLVGNISHVEVKGGKILAYLKLPTPAIVYNLTYPMISLVKEADGKLLGTGSFVIESAEGDYVKLSPNPHSLLVGESAIRINVIPEDSSRTIALETGEIDLNLSVPPIDKKLLLSKGFSVDSIASVTTEMVWLNNKKLDLDTRKLIHSVINREEIVKNSLEGEGTATASLVPRVAFGFLENEFLDFTDLKPYSGKKIKIVTNDVNTRKTNAQILQANLKSVGIDSEIQILDWGKYLEMSANGEHDILMGGWVTPNYDSEGILRPLFYSKTSPAGGRRTFFENGKFDEILESSYVYEKDEREKNLKLAQEEVFKNHGIIPLYYPNYLVGYSKNIQGFIPDPRGLYDFSQLKFSKN